MSLLTVEPQNYILSASFTIDSKKSISISSEALDIIRELIIMYSRSSVIFLESLFRMADLIRFIIEKLLSTGQEDGERESTVKAIDFK